MGGHRVNRKHPSLHRLKITDESADLETFAPFTVNPESLSVVDGKICLEFAPTDDAAFFRFSVQ